MDIHVDIRGFLESHVWICYGFSHQGTFLVVVHKIELNSHIL